MDIEQLMSGIAVVIDDALDPTSDAYENDQIRQIVDWFEAAWNLPFVRMKELPKEALRPNLFRSASFVLLDWRLWAPGAEMHRQAIVNDILGFLETARENLVPVIILTNEPIDDVVAELRKLPLYVYDAEAGNTNFLFVERKSDFWTGTSVNVDSLNDWVYGNASVYALKTWNQVMGDANGELFREMSMRSVNWPKVFWETYKKDGADPSVSLTSLINDGLRGRMRVDAFEDHHLAGRADEVPIEEVRGLIVETSFRINERLPADEVRCGDLYKMAGGKYWLNLRPDCDCIPRDGGEVGDIQVYCVEGKKLGPSQFKRRFKNGHFDERVYEGVAFGIADGQKSILFDFSKFHLCKYSEVRERRAGRLLHPYVTRMQQRYALFIQRQALPRIPDAVSPAAPVVEKHWEPLKGVARYLP